MRDAKGYIMTSTSTGRSTSWLSKRRDAKRLERFKRFMAQLPQGDYPEERRLPFTPPTEGLVEGVQARELFVSSVDYRALLISERRQDHKMRAFVERCVAGEHTLFFDVGANYGEFVASAVGSLREVVAIEANPIIARCLKRTFRDEPSVRVAPYAVSDREGMLTMSINPQYSGGNKLLGEGERSNSYFLEGCTFLQEVACKRLRDVLSAEVGSHERVAIKMDVEGHEPVLLHEVLKWLKGAQELKGLLLMFEFNSNAHEQRPELISLLKDFSALGAELSHLPERKRDSEGLERFEKGSEAALLERHGEVLIELTLA